MKIIHKQKDAYHITTGLRVYYYIFLKMNGLLFSIFFIVLAYSQVTLRLNTK